MLNLNKYTPLFMKMFLPILVRASYTRIHIDRNLYMWVFLKLRGQKSTLFGTSTKSSTFLRQTLLIKCRQPQNTSSKIYLSMYTFVKEYLQPFWGLFTVFSYQNNESQSTWPFSREIYRGEVMNSTERPGKERMRRSSIPMLLPYEGMSRSTAQIICIFYHHKMWYFSFTSLYEHKSSIYQNTEKIF